MACPGVVDGGGDVQVCEIALIILSKKSLSGLG